MDFYLTLSDIMAQKGMSIPDVARACGLTDSTVRSIIDRKQKKIALNVAFKLSRGLNVTLEQLNGENSTNTSSEQVKHQEPAISSSEFEHIKKYRTLDEYGKEAIESVLDIEYRRCSAPAETEPEENIIYLPEPLQTASAGFGQLADDETSNKVAVLYNSYTAKADYIMRVSGNSMEPDILDGDRVLVRKQPAVEQGETGIFIRDGERYVKIYRGDHLESINPEYPDLPLEEFSICIGKVICRLNPEWVVE